MTTKKGVHTYKLRKHIDRLMEVYVDKFPLNPCRSMVILQPEAFGEMLRLRKPTLGEPEVVCMSVPDQIMVYPTPDRKMKLLVRGIRFVDQ